MIAKTAHWGNSIGVRIPSAVAKKAGIGANSTIEINNTEGGIIIRPAERQEYSLKELVKEITAQNRHAEVDYGQPVGKELL
ncbi:MAG: AbrB/MazE/SpoVT family DNA-binding domain-containing protein [Nitrospirae bacterium]|nr:AbrB/MazE/SpoVT family DNA-binding domain-containing protein [Nitrospirota bacterium]